MYQDGVLTSVQLHLPDVDHFPVSDAKRARVVDVVRELRAILVFVVSVENIEEKSAAPDRLCRAKTVHRYRVSSGEYVIVEGTRGRGWPVHFTEFTRE